MIPALIWTALLCCLSLNVKNESAVRSSLNGECLVTGENGVVIFTFYYEKLSLLPIDIFAA